MVKRGQHYTENDLQNKGWLKTNIRYSHYEIWRQGDNRLIRDPQNGYIISIYKATGQP
jgi:hypothetical protein